MWTIYCTVHHFIIRHKHAVAFIEHCVNAAHAMSEQGPSVAFFAVVLVRTHFQKSIQIKNVFDIFLFSLLSQ